MIYRFKKDRTLEKLTALFSLFAITLLVVLVLILDAVTQSNKKDVILCAPSYDSDLVACHIVNKNKSINMIRHRENSMSIIKKYKEIKEKGQ